MNEAPYVQRHPRRIGFVIFNVLVAATLVWWALFTSQWYDDGIAGIPNLVLGLSGVVLLIALWVGGWVAWGAMIAAHRRNGP
jgi:hypothetical protein